MNTRILLMAFFSLVFAKQETFSQGSVSHELGVIAGPVAFYSDFGQRNNFETNAGNIGVGIGIVHYLNFYSRDMRNSFFTNHFMIRNEIDYHKSTLKHFGKWVDESRTSLFADQLRAMSGSATVIEIGTQLEYFPLNLRDFANGQYKISPFISAGVHLVGYKPEVSSSMGQLNNPATTPDKYNNAFRNRSGSTFALVGSVGLRYKLTQMSDLMMDLKWHHYFSDWVDGLNPSEENNGRIAVPENKSNDWMFWLNVGYIFYLDDLK